MLTCVFKDEDILIIITRHQCKVEAANNSGDSKFYGSTLPSGGLQEEQWLQRGTRKNRMFFI